MTVELWRAIEDLRQKLDDLTALQGVPAWTTWTPTVTQGSAVTHTVNHARYTRLGKVLMVTMRVTFTAAGTAANVILVSGMPADVLQAGTEAACFGSFIFFDTGTGYRAGSVRSATGGTTLSFIVESGTSRLGVNPAVTIASGDELSFTALYEIA